MTKRLQLMIKTSNAAVLLANAVQTEELLDGRTVTKVKSNPLNATIEVDFDNGMQMHFRTFSIQQILTKPETEVVVIDPPKDGWSHLISRNLDYLHEFCKEVGVPRKFFHNSKRHPHYDINEAYFRRVLDSGAVYVPSKKLLTYYKTGDLEVYHPNYVESIVDRVSRELKKAKSPAGWRQIAQDPAVKQLYLNYPLTIDDLTEKIKEIFKAEK